MYSLGLGDLAERSYIFISFNGDNLFDIVMKDKSKITYRTYHLVNQAFLPYSEIKTFTLVFVRFIYLLWKTGSLPEDKVNWLKFLSNTLWVITGRRRIYDSCTSFQGISLSCHIRFREGGRPGA